jgi:hypothetical protein
MLKSRKSLWCWQGTVHREHLNQKREHLNRGRVRAFKKKSRKTVKKYGTLFDRPKRSLAENGRVRTRSVDKFGAPTVVF